MSKYKVGTYDIDVIHSRMLKVASEVDRICRVHNWKCSLYGGSVLGAVRHNGFIPWDHDIDMAMPRKDYDNFLNYMSKHPNPIIFCSNYYSEKRYPNSWTKVRLNDTVFLEKELEHLPELHKGVFIDLHPIDNIIPSLLKIQSRMVQFWSCVNKVKSKIDTRNNFQVRIYKLFSWMPYSIINRFRDISMKLFKPFKTRYVYKLSHPNHGLYPIKRSIFEDLIEHKFEDHTFFIPREYDTFLKERYGDYMTFPPEAYIYDCCTSIVEIKL